MEKLSSFLVNFCTVNSLWFASYSNKCTTWKVKYSHNDEYWSKVHKSMHPIWTLEPTIVYQPRVLLIVFSTPEHWYGLGWAKAKEDKMQCSSYTWNQFPNPFLVIGIIWSKGHLIKHWEKWVCLIIFCTH